jgi:hypothetical protein
VQQTEAIAPAERDSDSRFLSPPWVWAKLLTGSENQLSKQCPTNIGGFTRSAAHWSVEVEREVHSLIDCSALRQAYPPARLSWWSGTTKRRDRWHSRDAAAAILISDDKTFTITDGYHIVGWVLALGKASIMLLHPTCKFH